MKTIVETDRPSYVVIGHMAVKAPVPVKIEVQDSRANKLRKLTHVGRLHDCDRLVSAQALADAAGVTIIAANRVVKPQISKKKKVRVDVTDLT